MPEDRAVHLQEILLQMLHFRDIELASSNRGIYLAERQEHICFLPPSGVLTCWTATA